MSTAKQDAFNSRAAKIRESILFTLDVYYGNDEKWASAENDVVGISGFYGLACDYLLQASLLYGYEIEPFAKKYLTGKRGVQLGGQSFEPYHYDLLIEYCLSRLVVGLLLGEGVNKEAARNALEYHHKKILLFGFGSELDFVENVKIDNMLMTFTPQMMVCKLLGEDYSEAAKTISAKISPGKRGVWGSAWRFLYEISEAAGTAEVDKRWLNVLRSWRSCFVSSDPEAFSYTYFVLIYFFYSQARNMPFDMKDLSKQFMGY